MKRQMVTALALAGIAGGVAYLILRTEQNETRRKHDMSTVDERLSGIADALSTKMDTLGTTIGEIKTDITSLKDAAAGEGVSPETIAKFEALEDKLDGLATSAREAADIVPASGSDTSGTAVSDATGDTSGIGDANTGADTGLSTGTVTGPIVDTGAPDTDIPAGVTVTEDDGFGTNGPTGP